LSGQPLPVLDRLDPYLDISRQQVTRLLVEFHRAGQEA
jgi:hypothetical protein